MAAIRFQGVRALNGELLNPGDTVLTSDQFSALTTVGAATVPAAQLITGVLYRTGSTANYTDTFDTASNVMQAMAGNGPMAAIGPGLSFKFRIINTVAFTETITLGAGMIAGSGTIATVPASSWREFLFTYASVQPPLSNIGLVTSGSPVIPWYMPPGQTVELQGPSPLAVNVMPGAAVSGTGIPAGATVLGITEGQGGSLGITISANATSGTNTVVALSFGPQLVVNSTGSGTL